MQRIDAGLFTPIYIKTDAEAPWPSEKVFYLLTRDGLFLCRNHEYFKSCVPAPRWPSELADHKAGLHLNYPAIPIDLFQQVVGFFDRAWRKLGGESCVLLAYNRSEKKVEVIVPEQVATVSRNYWGETAIGLNYQMPKDLPSDVTIFCDIHSHCDMAAYASGTDEHDETHRTGLHIVVGKLQHEPCQFHAEAVADGKRFRVNTDVLLAGYRARDYNFPKEWLDRVSAEYYGAKKSTSAWAHDDDRTSQYGYSGGYSGGYYGGYQDKIGYGNSGYSSGHSTGYSQGYVGAGYKGGESDRNSDEKPRSKENDDNERSSSDQEASEVSRRQSKKKQRDRYHLDP
jgi:hypothetical protein